ncbi:MAG: PEGA domain-containing protein [Pseudomonadales bacterium]|nr:PEGA domain-containing protein [Pseudomonadales bacterium]
MTDHPGQDSPGSAAADDLIVPIDFTPAALDKRRFAFRLNPVRIVLGIVLFVFAVAAWFVLTAKSVYFDLRPVGSELSVQSPLAIQIGPRYLLRTGDVEIKVKAEGYYELDTSLNIGPEQAQTFNIELIRLPGFLNLSSGPITQARVVIDGEEVGLTPLSAIELAAGEHHIHVEKERYQAVDTNIDIEGRSLQQTLVVDLLPAWANITVNTSPPGATVSVDGEERGLTPLSTEVLEGKHEILVKLAAHKAWTDVLAVQARQDQTLPPIALIPADGLVLLRSTPSNATVTLNGDYQGQTPLEIAVPPGSQHRLSFFLNGYQEHSQTLRINPDQEASVNVTLKPILSSVQIVAQPADAQLYVNGKLIGNANQTIELLAASQTIEVRREGYVSYQTDFISRPGIEQRLDIELKSLEQQKLESIKPQITNAAGQTLKLLYPTPFTMGASRREAGRQANEVLRDINLSRPFYLSLHEVTNAQFKQFRKEHSSGVLQGRTLDNASQPVVRVSWEDAALFCNWLSIQESLPPFYTVADDKVTGFNPDSSGYRLPTEAEWEWAARVNGSADSLLRFPWGDQLPPPANHGNYADISAASFLGRIIVNYNDSFMGSAPVGSFEANSNGFFDMGGNVAEWTHDFYGASGVVGNQVETNPFGPDDGRYHVVRGSSWAHGTITELRLSYRDYSDEARDDLGFRVARYLEP